MTTTLLVGGRVYSPADPFATAMLIDGEMVAWVGSAGAATGHRDGVDQVVELDGALVTPAFVDAHVHSTATGIALSGLDLRTCTTLAGALDRIEAFARERRGVGVLLGHGWDENAWPEGRPPTREELDRATYGGVCYLTRIDVHSAVASSALLAAVPELAGLAGFRSDGWLSRDAHHAARAAALASVTSTQRSAAQRATRQRAAELGVALLHELGGPEISSADDFTAVLALARSEPGPEVAGYWGELRAPDRARSLGALGAAGDLFADGALGSHTACLRTPYLDAETSGHCYLTAAEVRDHVVACTVAGLQAGFPVIGDGALDVVANGLIEAAAVIGEEAIRAARHRLEHLEMPDQAHLVTLARLGVYASVQPVFDALWGGTNGMYATRLGAERAGRMNPYAAMAAAGIPLVLGSDSPVTPLGPWEAVRAAAFHQTPESRLSVRAAFSAHTRAGWQATGDDASGVLAPGAPATYAVWRAAGLPDLAPGTPVPDCLRTALRGTAIFTQEGALC